MPIRTFEKDDIQPLTRILDETGFFRKEEIDVAVELMQIVCEDPEQTDYLMRTYVDETAMVRGYYCAGPTPMTNGTFDLYWIAVDPGAQHRGIGKELLQRCEEDVRSLEGRLIIVETSSQEKYKPTRLFYERNGFTEAARVKDYYAAGDDLVIFSKHLRKG